MYKVLLQERKLTPKELDVITSVEVNKFHFTKSAFFNTKNGVALSFGWILDLDDDAGLNIGDKVSLEDILIRQYSMNGYRFETLTVRHNMTVEEALATAQKYMLENEVQWCIDNGYTPEEALLEWDIL